MLGKPNNDDDRKASDSWGDAGAKEVVKVDKKIIQKRLYRLSSKCI